MYIYLDTAQMKLKLHGESDISNFQICRRKNLRMMARISVF